MKKIIALFSAGYFYLIFAIPAYAQITQLEGSRCLFGGSTRQVATLDCFPIIIMNIATILLILAGIVAVFMIIFSGFKFVTSSGDAKQAEGARKTLTFAVIGLIVVMLVFVIVPAIASVTGIRRECLLSFGFSQCVPDDIAFHAATHIPMGFALERESAFEVDRQIASLANFHAAETIAASVELAHVKDVVAKVILYADKNPFHN